METQTEQQGLFIQNQEDLTEEINLILYNKPRAKQIKKSMSEFVKGLK
jgi:hypothetical protein